MKIALVTGGSSGIGLATAETLMQAGMCVYAVSRNITEKTQTHSSGGQIISMRMDVFVNLKPNVHRTKKSIGNLNISDGFFCHSFLIIYIM